MKIYYLFAMILVIYYIATIRIKIPDGMMPPSPYHLTAKMAYPLCQVYGRFRNICMEKGKGRHLLQYERRIQSTLKAMDPMKNAWMEQQKRLLHKCSMTMLILVVGSFVSCLAGYQSTADQNLMEGQWVARNAPMEDEKINDLIVTTEDGMEKEVKIQISSQQYTQKELENLAVEIEPILVDTVLDQNTSQDQVTHNLAFPSSMEGYPFELAYDWNSEYVDYNGAIDFEQLPDAGVILPITIRLCYEDWEKDVSFQCYIKKPELTREEQILKKLDDSLRKADQQTITEDKILLPDSVDGISISWSEKKTDRGQLLLGIFVMLSIFIFFAMDKDLFQKKEERKEEMLSDYPEIVSKITLLTGAGLTLKGALKRMVTDYQKELSKGKKERFAWNELVICIREMESGISEIEAYDRLGKRCQIQEYIKFSSLISQNLRKGTQGFTNALQTEAALAMESKKNAAKIQGEKIGTKILMPMMLLLLLVMIMIMMPALGSL